MLKFLFLNLALLGSILNIYSNGSPSNIKETIEYNTMKLEPNLELNLHSRTINIRPSRKIHKNPIKIQQNLLHQNKIDFYSLEGGISPSMSYASSHTRRGQYQATTVQFTNKDIGNFFIKNAYSSNTVRQFTLNGDIGTDPTNPIPTPLNEEYLWLLLLLLAFAFYKFIRFNNGTSPFKKNDL